MQKSRQAFRQQWKQRRREVREKQASEQKNRRRISPTRSSSRGSRCWQWCHLEPSNNHRRSRCFRLVPRFGTTGEMVHGVVTQNRIRDIRPLGQSSATEELRSGAFSERGSTISKTARCRFLLVQCVASFPMKIKQRRKMQKHLYTTSHEFEIYQFGRFC